MKNLLKTICMALTAAALCLPACAQEDEAPYDEAPAQTQNEPDAETPAAKKPAAKKTAAKKPAAKKKPYKKKKPVSEYKFASTDATPTYKFDKKANPILKKAKKKKSAKAAGNTGSKPAPKLKKVKSFGEEDAPETPGMPPGMPEIGGQ